MIFLLEFLSYLAICFSVVFLSFITCSILFRLLFWLWVHILDFIRPFKIQDIEMSKLRTELKQLKERDKL